MDTYDNVRRDVRNARKDLNNALLTLTEIALDNRTSAEIIKDIRDKVGGMMEPRAGAYGNVMYNLAINNVLSMLDKYNDSNR